MSTFSGEDQETLYRAGVPVRVTTLARTVLDVLSRPELCGGVEEIWNSLLHLEALDLEELRDYASALDNATLFSRAGYFLERRQQVLRVFKKDLLWFEKRLGPSVHFFRRGEKSFLSKRWQLMVPTYLKEGRFEGA